MTEIKGAGIDQKEGMTVDGGFHIDDEEVRAGLTDTRAPASDRFIRSLRWEFGLIALVIPIKNVHCGSPATSPAFFSRRRLFIEYQSEDWGSVERWIQTV